MSFLLGLVCNKSHAKEEARKFRPKNHQIPGVHHLYNAMTATQKFCQKMRLRHAEEGQEEMQAEEASYYLPPTLLTSQHP